MSSAAPAPAPPIPIDLDALTTPLAWSDADGAITGCNLAFARWLAVSTRRLVGWPMSGLDDEGRLAEALARPGPTTKHRCVCAACACVTPTATTILPTSG